jgi:uncharacterized protein
MRIEIEKLEETGGKFAESYAPDQLIFEDSELQLTEPVTVRGQARRKGSEVELRGELHAKAAAPCGRCLQPVELPIEVRFTERFVPAVSWRNEPQHELQHEDLNIAVFDGAGIELDDLVKEEILLAVPGHVLCRGDCKGLCPVCGADRNQENCECESGQVDSRWEKLKDLRF